MSTIDVMFTKEKFNLQKKKKKIENHKTGDMTNRKTWKDRTKN